MLKDLKPNLYNLFQKIQEGTLSNSFHEASIILITKPDKNSTKKTHCRPISLMNMNAQIFNNTLADRIQQCIKTIVP